MSEPANRAFQRPPGPKPNRTPWGFAKYIKEISANPVAFVGRRFAAHGDIYYAPIGKSDLYVTRHPDHINQVLKTQARHFIKPEEGRTATILRRFLGVGVLNANGEVWRRQRRMIQPSLNRSRLRTYAESMVAETQRHLDKWIEDEPFDLADSMVQLTLNVVTRVLFDVDMSESAARAAVGIEGFRTAMDSSQIVPAWIPTPTNRRVAKALRDTDAMMGELVAERRSLPAEQLAARDDLLSVLVQATDDSGEGMTDRQLRDELLTLFFAGHETTSNALAWTFHLLSKHPDVDQRLRELVRDTLGERAATVDDLGALAPLQHAIEEAMRIYPPVYAIARVATADVDLGDYVIPSGSEVVMWIYWAQHDERWWDEPEAFRPERFAEGAAAIKPGSYIPFGGGQRVCIGQHFALMEATLILATVLQRYELEATADHPVDMRLSITMSPKHGLQFTPRAHH